MEVAQRDVWWADLGDSVESATGYHRPVVVVQGDDLNSSRSSTYLCVPLTGNLRWGAIPTNLRLPARATGLDQDSIAQVGLMLAVSESQLIECVGKIPHSHLEQLFARIDLALGRVKFLA